MPQIELGNIKVDVEQKDIKNIHLSVYPPNGRVKISAPNRMDLDTIRVYAISKLKWIKKKQEQFSSQERESPREYLTKESHYFFGKRYLLKVLVHNASASVTLTQREIIMQVRPDTPAHKKQEILDEWYRTELKKIIPTLISKWEAIIGVKINEFGVKRMRTKWGTCNQDAIRIWLNLELAKKPVDCLEYIIVHELVHLLERSHNHRFISYMDKFLPKWRSYKEELNRLPVSHLNWIY
jgi:predicted metal-dependent hydrolase